MTDFNVCKNKTAVDNLARETAFDILINAYIQAVGEDNVSIVGNNTISVCLGLRTLSDGQQGEVCVEIKPVVKNFDFRTTASGKTFEPYERLNSADAYEIEKSEKERKAEEKAREKARRAEADKKARAKRAEEKARAKQGEGNS